MDGDFGGTLLFGLPDESLYPLICSQVLRMPLLPWTKRTQIMEEFRIHLGSGMRHDFGISWSYLKTAYPNGSKWIPNMAILHRDPWMPFRTAQLINICYVLRDSCSVRRYGNQNMFEGGSKFQKRLSQMLHVWNIYPLVMTNIAMEHGPLIIHFPIKTSIYRIFHGYVE